MCEKEKPQKNGVIKKALAQSKRKYWTLEEVWLQWTSVPFQAAGFPLQALSEDRASPMTSLTAQLTLNTWFSLFQGRLPHSLAVQIWWTTETGLKAKCVKSDSEFLNFQMILYYGFFFRNKNDISKSKMVFQ